MKDGLELVRHRVTIGGRVVDAATEKPVAAADVTILTMPPAFERWLEFAAIAYGKRRPRKGSKPPHSTKWDQMLERPDRTQSRPDGLFYFLDLPDGEYGLQVAMPSLGRRYGQVKVSAKVSRDAAGDPKWLFVRCALPPTLVRGKVTGTGQQTGIPLARVRVKGSGERAFTDAQGQYLVTGIEPGKKRTLLVTAQGYAMKSQDFALLEPGASRKIDFELTRENG